MKANSQNRFPYYLPVVFALLLIIGIFLGLKLAPTSSENNVVYSLGNDDGQKINQIVNYISSDYVDTINKKQLVDDAINNLLKDLDPHSQYITKEEFDEYNDPLVAKFEGIGISFRIEKDTINVINTIPGGPSEKVGLQAGDRIVSVNDSTIAGVGIKNKDAIRLLKGPRGTKVDVGIFRRGLPDTINYTITRDIIPTFSLDIAYMVNDSIGYMKINKFSATTYEEADKAMKKLKANGMTKLILDLRGNSGGYLTAAINLADEFLKDKQLIVYTQGNNRPRKSAYATNKGRLQNEDLVILIDEGSASASEIIAGAIQDNDRGAIIGRRSFGKGLVQEQIALPDGSAFRLTVARYYTPTGRSIQKPYNEGKEEYYMESYERYLNGEMQNADSIRFNDSLKYTTPKGRVVYGGGGIMPDIYIPLSADSNNVLFNVLANKGLVFRFAFEYTDTHRKDLMKYKSFDDFNKQFKITNTMYNDLLTFAKEKGVKFTIKQKRYSRNKIATLLKAYIGRNIYDEKGFYPIYNNIDNTFQKAVDYLKHPTPLVHESDTLKVKTN
ncbi:MAG: S41 family peptidase [Hyphomicrobiales bacterium]